MDTDTTQEELKREEEQKTVYFESEEEEQEQEEVQLYSTDNYSSDSSDHSASHSPALREREDSHNSNLSSLTPPPLSYFRGPRFNRIIQQQQERRTRNQEERERRRRQNQQQSNQPQQQNQQQQQNQIEQQQQQQPQQPQQQQQQQNNNNNVAPELPQRRPPRVINQARANYQIQIANIQNNQNRNNNRRVVRIEEELVAELYSRQNIFIDGIEYQIRKYRILDSEGNF